MILRVELEEAVAQVLILDRGGPLVKLFDHLTEFSFLLERLGLEEVFEPGLDVLRSLHVVIKVRASSLTQVDKDTEAFHEGILDPAVVQIDILFLCVEELLAEIH